MATKSDFTGEEWESLQWAVVDSIAYLSLADPGFWDSFKEATGAAKYIAQQREASGSVLIRDLATDVKAKRDPNLTANATDISGEAVKRIEAASAIIAEKAPEELEAFKAFVLGLADATAMAAGGMGDTETDAIEKIAEALG